MDTLMSPCFCKHFLLAYRHLLILYIQKRCLWSRCHTSTSVQRSCVERAMQWPFCPNFYPRPHAPTRDIPPCSALRIVTFFAQLKIASAEVPRSADRPTPFPSFGSGRKQFTSCNDATAFCTCGWGSIKKLHSTWIEGAGERERERENTKQADLELRLIGLCGCMELMFECQGTAQLLLEL